MSDFLEIPKDLINSVLVEWGDGSWAARHHAAKQIACWLANGAFEHDLNAQADAYIKLGMLAALSPNARQFIRGAAFHTQWPWDNDGVPR